MSISTLHKGDDDDDDDDDNNNNNNNKLKLWAASSPIRNLYERGWLTLFPGRLTSQNDPRYHSAGD